MPKIPIFPRQNIHGRGRPDEVSGLGVVVLGFDFGAKRIGVAVGNTLTGAARPLGSIGASTVVRRFAQVAKYIDEWAPERLVVGIPRHPDGQAHEMSRLAEKFARQLEGRFKLPVMRVDERYSSAVVEGAQDVDAQAAAVILQQWLDEGEAAQ